MEQSMSEVETQGVLDGLDAALLVPAVSECDRTQVKGIETEQKKSKSDYGKERRYIDVKQKGTQINDSKGNNDSQTHEDKHQ